MDEKNNSNSEITDTQKLLQLMKDQNKELKISKKKLEKLEEKFIQVNTDLKNVVNDKTNIELFLKEIFPKDIADKVIKKEYGTYETAELTKLWLISESQNQNEYTNILSKLKSEINELKSNNKELQLNLDNVNLEYNEYKENNKENEEKLKEGLNELEDLRIKVVNLDNEKQYLMKVIDEKNNEIEVLNNLELENAELKAKSLLNNFDTLTPDLNSNNNDIFNYSNSNNSKKQNNQNDNSKNQIKIENLNMGTQTDIKLYTKEEYDKLLEELENMKIKNEKLKNEFNDYKAKSHKIFISNESNYNKILKEHENLKKELADLLNKHKESQNKNKNLMVQIKNNEAHPQIEVSSVGPIQNYTKSQKVNMEYLKNITLKYLEALAIGNEFESKILENVIFTVLNVSKNEIKYLEEKRITSSFYYNLWYNAKAFLTSKIYGEQNEQIESNNKNQDNNVNINNLEKQNIALNSENSNNKIGVLIENNKN